MVEHNASASTGLSTPGVRVVVFSGGRGAEVLSENLVRDPRVELTLAINGYDDGKSTGEVRRFLGDCLGPSDFRKNASTMARGLGSCSEALIELLDLRFPDAIDKEEALACLSSLVSTTTRTRPETDGVGSEREAYRERGERSESGERPQAGEHPFAARLHGCLAEIDGESAGALGDRLARFCAALESGRGFDFRDCSIGNLVFAGCFLAAGRDFNAAVADYCALLALPEGMIENVTDGTNAYLVALDRDGRVLSTEAEIVESRRPVNIRDIWLIDRPFADDELDSRTDVAATPAAAHLASRAIRVAPNPRILERLRAADLIIYAPGTQHSSLFPSYLTPGVGAAIASNLGAVKILITNIHEDAEINDTSAVELIDRALHYLREKGRTSIPAPCLITHYLLNDPGHAEVEAPYVPLGRLAEIEDPRLVRIANYEQGTSGRHDAVRILGPFIERFLRRRERPRIAVLLLESRSLNTISQTLLEMLRGDIESIGASVTVFYDSVERLDNSFVSALPFAVEHAPDARGPTERSRHPSARGQTGHENAGAPASSGTAAAETVSRPANAPFSEIIRNSTFDFFLLFESSGMYKGNDIVNVASLLSGGRFDAVWGSRRLSVRDIRESYKLRYRNNLLLGGISYAGSHMLSLAFLLLYGRYISDTLSGVRAIRRPYLQSALVDLDHKCLNQQLLSMLLRDRAEIFETPVQFFPIAPEKVRRTRVLDGLQSLGTILWWRWRSLRRAPERPAPRAAAPEPQPGPGGESSESAGSGVVSPSR